MGWIPGALIGLLAGDAVKGAIIGAVIAAAIIYRIFGAMIKLIGTEEFQIAMEQAKYTGEDQYIDYRGRTMTIHAPACFKPLD